MPGLLACLSSVLLLGAIVTSAWLGDDALITFRTVENWVNGHGLRWNVDERVQTFTHPLWLFLVAAVRAAGGDLFYAVIALSVTLSALAAAILVATTNRGPLTAAALLLLLASSRAFVDYSTSGLESPLTHLLLAGLAFCWLRTEDPHRRCLRCALLVGLLLTNRMDLLWISLPVLLTAAIAIGPRAALPRLALGLSPFGLWLLFATFYYGTPFPSTAYAKAFATGLAPGDLMQQGLRYCADLCQRDPTTALVVLAAVPALALRSLTGARALALGAILQTLYVIRVGGDFMAGRFFTPPFVFALVALVHASSRWQPNRARLAAAIAVAAAFLACLPPWLSRGALTRQPSPPELPYGIGDERSYYYPYYGLLSPTVTPPVPGVFSDAQRQLGTTRMRVDIANIAGIRGLQSGDLVHVIDEYLCDPLLVRLPTNPNAPFRIGHFQRRIPEGLLESLASDQNRIVHPGLRAYYGALREVTRGPLWSWSRLGTIVALWRGDFAAGLDAYATTDYLTPPLVRVEASELDREVPTGAYWSWTAARVLREGGVEIVFADPQQARAVVFGIDGGDRLQVTFLRGETPVGEGTVSSQAPAYGGITSTELAVPPSAGGFDRIRLRGSGGADGVAAVASLRLLR